MEMLGKFKRKLSKGDKFYDLRSKRLLDIDRENFHYTVEDLIEHLSYGNQFT
jgi:hypothetical protein